MTRTYTRYSANKYAGKDGGHEIRIAGQRVNIHLARLTYRCRVCLGKLERVGFGLKCKADHDHRGFVHQSDIKRLKDQQESNINQLSQFYKVVNGKVIAK